jgi:hypothetical protein
MRRRLPPRFATALLLSVAVVAPVAGAPVDSDLGAAQLGGGCYPTGIQPALFDMLTLIDPEWAPVVNGMTVDSMPVLMHGTVEEMHGDLSGDFPATHLRADVNLFLRPDPEDTDFLATGNGDGRLHFEWEAGVYPAWAWAGVGDRLIGLGRWIFDCGHPDATPGNCSATTSRQCVLDGDCRPPLCPGCGSTETCLGTHFGYSTELHPPQATVAIRTGRGAIVSSKPGDGPVAATRADIYVSDQAGGAGDRCILTHRASPLELLSVECFPLSQPVAPLNAQDFVFDVPLPPRPAQKHNAVWRLVTYDTPGGAPARLKVKRSLKKDDPHLHVTVRMTRKNLGQLPTGFAGTIFAGWRRDPSPLVHVRLTVTELVVRNALQLAVPIAPRTCSTSDTPCATSGDCPSGESCLGIGPVKSWRLQAAVNGEWQEFTDLENVSTGDVIAQGLVYDQYLPPDGAVHLEVNGRAQECVDTMYGKSLATDLAALGFNKGIACLNSVAHRPGDIDVTYPAPDFGAGSGAMDYETVSTGGEGGHCSMNTGLLCVVDDDCPSGETCITTGGAFALRYRIERLP